jgi:hypothetical protein
LGDNNHQLCIKVSYQIIIDNQWLSLVNYEGFNKQIKIWKYPFFGFSIIQILSVLGLITYLDDK